MAHTYAIVGTWMFKPVERGISVFRYDPETAKMTFLKKYDPTVAAGQQYFDKKRGVLYVVDETDGHPGEAAGGGFLRAYKLDPETGDLTLLTEARVPMTKPSYVWLDSRGEYALVSCHTGRSAVTKVVRTPEGKLTSAVIYEDAGLCLFRLNAEGGVEELCDVALYDGLTDAPGQVHAHLHSVMGDPTGSIFYSCDKGLDRVYSYAIDYDRGLIVRKAETVMDYATAPRYLAFHPTLKVLYENNETSKWVFAFRYDTATGALAEVNRVPLVDNDERVSPSDLTVSRDGRFLFAADRAQNLLVVYEIDQATGALTHRQTLPVEEGPRGIAASPDGRFLLTAMNARGEVHAYAIGRDGTLSDAGSCGEVPYAANLSIVEV